MADDKEKQGGAERRRVAADQPYEVSYFRKKHNITLEQAKTIIERHGSSRDKANQAAGRLKSR